jgi:hypothetical protein
MTADKGLFTATSAPVTVTAGMTTALTLRYSATAVSIAVVQGEYDSVETVLTDLGFTWTYINKSDLNNAILLSGYQILFLNCGLDNLGAPLDLSLDMAFATTVMANLQNFVNAGKRLYISDWAYVYLEKAFPTAIAFFGNDTNFALVTCDETQARIGDTGTIAASILDSSLATALGRTTMDVNFDLFDWVVMGRASAMGPDTRVLVNGPVVACGASRGTRPLMATFPYGSGEVIYTSFHKQALATADMDRVLEDVVMH